MLLLLQDDGRHDGRARSSRQHQRKLSRRYVLSQLLRTTHHHDPLTPYVPPAHLELAFRTAAGLRLSPGARGELPQLVTTSLRIPLTWI